MTQTALENRAKIAEIKRAYATGECTYDEAKRLVQPIVDTINDAAKAIAKKHNVRPKRISASEVLR